MSNRAVTKALGERFSFTLKNTSGAALKVALLAAFFNTLLVTSAADGSAATIKYSNAAEIAAAGFPCDHVLDDGTIVTGLVATPSNPKMSIRSFRDYIKMEGRTLIDMSVQANNVAAFNSVIEVVKYTPLKGSAPQYLPLNDFRTVDQSSTDKINVRNIQLEMDYDTLMLLEIAEGHEITISYQFS